MMSNVTIVCAFSNHSSNGSNLRWNVSSTNESKTADCGRDTEILVAEYLWKTIPPVLFLVGITGNILAVILLRRLGLGKHPTLMFLFYLAFSNTVVLLTGLPHYWISYTFNIDIKTISNASCKLYYFFIYLSMQYSSWILVGVTTERLVKTYFPFKYLGLFTSKKVSIGLLVSLFLLVLVNGHFSFTNGHSEFTAGEYGSLNENFYYFDEEVFVFIDFALLSAVSFIIMLVSNILLFRILKSLQRTRVSMMHYSIVPRANQFSVRMTKMLVVCTFYFIISTAPISIYFILDTYLTPGYESTNNCGAQARMELVWTVTYLIQFSNYSINFYLYIAMNNRFLLELKNFLLCRTRFRGSLMRTIREGSSARSLAQQSVGSISICLEETANSISEENRL